MTTIRFEWIAAVFAVISIISIQYTLNRILFSLREIKEILNQRLH
ncbi:MAG: hypothetical protein PWQ12_1185 [Clostridiales bacterium]|jgi:hypothetical protein|nr:hypothetical protein [Clostridiales bacterium]